MVVIFILGILIAILAPVLEKAMEQSRLTVCGTNLHGISTALHTYASEYNDALPHGPDSASTVDPSRKWSRLGDSSVWVASISQYTGLGVLTKGYITNPRSLLCPIEDDKNFAPKFLANLGSATADARSSYLYRSLAQTTNDRLSNLGNNAVNQSAHALVMDWQSLGSGDYYHTSHDVNERNNVLYLDGHVQSFSDQSQYFAAQPADFSPFPAAWIKRLDQTWVTADWSEAGDPAKAPQIP